MVAENTNFGTGPTALSDHGFMARVILQDSGFTYVAIADPGTPVDIPRWSVCRVLTDGSVDEGTTVWADGSSAFKQKADDLTSLSYS